MVEILNQQQQDFIAMKAFEIEDWTGEKRWWWLGLTDLGKDKRWYWVHSLKVADFLAFDQSNPGGTNAVDGVEMYPNGDYEWYALSTNSLRNPICQFS